MSDILMLLRLVVLALVVIGAIAGIIRKFALKRKLADGLGRNVTNSELTDIGAWMRSMPDPPRTEKEK
jgi:hypothetical protein